MLEVVSLDQEGPLKKPKRSQLLGQLRVITIIGFEVQVTFVGLGLFPRKLCWQ